MRSASWGFGRWRAWAWLAPLLLAGCGMGVEVGAWFYDEPPTPVATQTRFTSAAMGDQHSCMLTATGEAWCWGLNDAGQLGRTAPACTSDPYYTCSPQPQPVAGLPPLVAADGGRFTSCGLAADGRAWCWGNLQPVGAIGGPEDRFVQLKVAVFGGQTCAVRASGLALSRIAPGQLHACALDCDGAAWCWGSNWYGQLGHGLDTSSTTPVAVAGGRRYAWIGVGAMVSCALDLEGVAWCWGSGSALGTGDPNAQSNAPVAVPGRRFAQLSVGVQHVCGREAGGAVWCWGQNIVGQIGDGTRTDRASPVPVAAGIAFTDLGAGGGATCAIDAAGAAWCWGWNAYGQVGIPVQAHWVAS